MSAAHQATTAGEDLLDLFRPPRLRFCVEPHVPDRVEDARQGLNIPPDG
ncbi:hypothetical protein [Pseudomonas kurunegalensis]